MKSDSTNPEAAMGTAAQVEPAIAWDEALGGWTVSSYEAVRLALLDPGRFDSEGNPIWLSTSRGNWP